MEVPARMDLPFFCTTMGRPQKVLAIQQAVAANDTWKLRELALEDGGLLDDSLRRLAWPLLLPKDEISWGGNNIPLTEQDRQAVRWDVERCAVSDEAKQILIKVIEQSCRYYYQGYHQIASQVLIIFNHDTQPTIHILRRLYRFHFGKYIARNDLPIVRLVQLMGPPILHRLDMDLYQVIDEYTFSVGSILTWFAASAVDQVVPRLFDAFMASHPLLPFYLSFALLLQHKQLILNEPMNVHKPPCIDVDNVDALIISSLNLMAQIPPNQRLWILASHYYGDGAVEDLLCTAASNSLLQLVTPESSITAPPCVTTWNTTPRAYIAVGMGRCPEISSYKRLVRWVVAVLASVLVWGWRKMESPNNPTTDETKSNDPHHTMMLSPPPLVNERTT